jgi:hypothetical protein
MSWVPLPTGKDIVTKKGSAYAALVATSHSEADIRSFATKHGLSVYSFEAKPSGILIAGTATANGSIPWGVPGILSWIDDSHAVQAWANADGGTPTPPGGEAPSKPVSLAPVWLFGSLVAATGVGWWLWSRRR